MPCVCTNNTLRLFIRNVAQLDLPIATKLSASTQFPRRRIPALKYAHASRLYSSESIAQYQVDFDGSIEPVPSRSRFRKAIRDGTVEESVAGQLSYIDEKGAIVDFSPDAIDTIVAEAAAEKAQLEHAASIRPKEDDTYDTPWRSLQRDMPRRREREERNPGSKTQGLIVKRGWSKSEGFKLHYSAAPDWQKVEKHGERLRIKKEKEAAERAKDDWVPPPKEPWMVAKDKAREKYPDGWNPLKRLSPDAMAGIRALHSQMPEHYTPWVLAEEFEVSQEAIQRILKTKWRPTADEETDREERWHKRGEKVWSRLADLGKKPPAEWRELGIGAGKPDWMKKRETPRPQTPLPALVTTARRREAQTQSKPPQTQSLADQII
jgi:hypothetical protein